MAFPPDTLQGGASGILKSAVATKTVDYSVTPADGTILVNAASGNRIVTLPDAASVTGQIFVIKKTDVSINIVTVACQGGQTIDGISTSIIGIQNNWIGVQSNGSNYFIISSS